MLGDSNRGRSLNKKSLMLNKIDVDFSEVLTCPSFRIEFISFTNAFRLKMMTHAVMFHYVRRSEATCIYVYIQTVEKESLLFAIYWY